MNNLKLVKPTKEYEGQVMEYKIDKCEEINLDKVLLTCDKENLASSKTIIHNGGILENEIIDEVGLSESGTIQRYWIHIK